MGRTYHHQLKDEGKKESMCIGVMCTKGISLPVKQLASVVPESDLSNHLLTKHHTKFYFNIRTLLI